MRSAKFRDGVAQRLGDAHRVVRRAVFQQHAEFVAAEPRERVAFAELALEQQADLAQELVARRVAAGIVDLLEAVKIQIEHRRGADRARRALAERRLQPVLELAPVGEPGQRIVPRLMRKLRPRSDARR